MNADIIQLPLKVWVCGSRTITKYETVEEVLNLIWKNLKCPIVIRTGGAIGVDLLAEQWARANNIPVAESIIPDWSRFGRGAGLIRNREGVDWADRVVGVWDGESRGTKHCLDYAESTNKPCTLYLR